MATKSPIIKEGPNKGWTHQEGDQYKVTGTDKAGKKVSMIFNNWPSALGINIYNGTKWLVRNGKSYVIQRITN